MDPRFLYRRMRSLRSAMNEVFSCDTAFGTCKVDKPSAGHCLLAAVCFQDIYGGDILTGEVKRTPHYWNRIELDDGVYEADLTADQFGEDPVRLERTLKRKFDEFSRRQGMALPDRNPVATAKYRDFQARLLPVLERRRLIDEAELLRSMWVPSGSFVRLP